MVEERIIDTEQELLDGIKIAGLFTSLEHERRWPTLGLKMSRYFRDWLVENPEAHSAIRLLWGARIRTPLLSDQRKIDREVEKIVATSELGAALMPFRGYTKP